MILELITGPFPSIAAHDEKTSHTYMLAELARRELKG